MPLPCFVKWAVNALGGLGGRLSKDYDDVSFKTAVKVK